MFESIKIAFPIGYLVNFLAFVIPCRAYLILPYALIVPLFRCPLTLATELNAPAGRGLPFQCSGQEANVQLVVVFAPASLLVPCELY